VENGVDRPAASDLFSLFRHAKRQFFPRAIWFTQLDFPHEKCEHFNLQVTNTRK